MLPKDISLKKIPYPPQENFLAKDKHRSQLSKIWFFNNNRRVSRFKNKVIGWKDKFTNRRKQN